MKIRKWVKRVGNLLHRTCETYPDLYWGYPEVQHAKNCTCEKRD